MVAIFTGSGFGFERGSASVLGGVGLLGNAQQGRGGDGVLVNAATGNLLIQKQDEFLVGRGPDASAGRTYNSLTTLLDDNNDRWRQSTDRRVYGLTGTLNTAGSTVKRVSADGSEIVYSWDATRSAYLAKDGAGAYDTIVKSGTEWVWTDGDSRTVERYFGDTVGKIKSVADNVGTLMTFAYDGSSRLSQVNTNDGSWIRYDYSGSTSNITQIVTGYTDLATSTAKTLTRTRYGYDGSNRLQTVTVDLSPGDNSVSDGKTYVTTYGYDGSSLRVNSITQSDGSSLTITFDGSNRVKTLVQTVSTGVTRTTTLDYFTGYSTVTDPTGQVTRLDYDANGNLTTITAPPAHSGATAQTVHFAYNANGDLTSTTDARGEVTSFSNFTTNGLARTITNRNGEVTTRTYDGTNHLLSEARNGIDATGASVAQTTRYVYNAAGDLRFAISAEGRVTEYVRNGYGAVTAEIEYAEAAYTTGGTPTEANMTTWTGGLTDRSWVKRIDYAYDARLNKQASFTYGIAASDGTGLGGTDGFGQVNFVYDQAGQLLSTLASGQGATSYVYDGMGRITATSDPDNGAVTIVFDDANTKTTITNTGGRITANTYNKAGDLIQASDGGTNVSGGLSSDYFAVDKLGRTRVTTYFGSSDRIYDLYDLAGRHTATIDGAGNITEYRYDANNRLVGTISYRNKVSSTNLTTLGNPDNTLAIAGIRPATHAEDTSSWTVYDDEGRVLQTIAGDGSTTISTYDASGRLQKTTRYVNKVAAVTVAGFIAAAPTVVTAPTANVADTYSRFFYDKDGLLIGSMDGEKYIVQNSYDKSGQLVATTAFANATTATSPATASFNTLIAGVTTASGRDRTTRYVYNGEGKLRYVVDALNQVTRYDYDYAGLRTRTAVYATAMAATSDYTYDNVKSLTTSLEASSSKRVSYAVYDSAGRLAYSLDPQGTAASSMAVIAYVYDGVGNLVRTVAYATLRASSSLPTKATMDSWIAANATADDRTTRMWYNGRNDLVYTVDAEGHIWKKHYDIKGRMVAEERYEVKTTTVTNASTYADVTALATGTNYATFFVYDSMDRIVQRWGRGTVTFTSYTYHGLTNLVTSETRAANGTATEQSTTSTVYDGAGRSLQITDAAGTAEEVLTTFSYDGRGTLTSSVDPRVTTTTYTYDLNGRIKTMTEAAGQAEQRTTTYDYNAFGDVWKVTDPRGNASYSWYDQLGRLTHQRDAENHLTTTAYTVFSEVQSVKRWKTALAGTASMATAPTGTSSTDDATTTFTYDKAGRVLTSADALSQIEYYNYNAFGDRTSVINRASNTTTYTFDRLGRVTRESFNAATTNINGAGTTSAGGQVVKTYTYDSRGNMKVLTEGYSTTAGGAVTALRTTNYAYDAQSRVSQITYDQVTVIADDMVTTSTATPTEQFTYDKRGNVIKSIDKAGAQTFSFYDDLDRKIAEIRQLSASTAVYSSYVYDDNGNLTLTKVYEGNAALPSTPGGTAPAVPSGLFRQTDFFYDKLDRLTISVVVSNGGNVIRSGTWNGTSYSQSTGGLANQYQYDANGNVVKAIDANNATTWNWYDKLDRKTDQLDGEGYLTHWTYDAEGNVLSETRYARQFTGSPTLLTPATVAAEPGADRTTIYTYDRNGNRLTEKRTGVIAWNINASTGDLSGAGTDAVISYTYNALSQVQTKTVAGVQIAIYIYDATGRLTTEQRASFTDANGTLVTPRTTYQYDALGALTVNTQLGAGGGTYGAGGRQTTYRYGEGGRLLAMVDAGSNLHSYSYDVAGRLKKDAYNRVVNSSTAASSGATTTVAEAQTKTYDLGGRVLSQSIYSTVGGTFKRIGLTSFQYNNFDQVTQQGVGTASATDIAAGTALYQTINQYDAGGRLVGTNSGDGVWKFFGYDRVGNQTAALTSAGASFSSGTGLAGALALVGNANVNGTYTVYDKRNQATQVVEEGRDMSASVTGQQLTTSRTYNAFGEVATETDARANTITYSYNTMGRMIRSESPGVQVTNENGGTNWIKPSEDYYYDLGGRLIATFDANGTYDAGSVGSPAAKHVGTGSSTKFALLAGTGYDGSEALVSTEFHMDSGKKQTLYDIMGDARVLRSEIFDYANASTTTQFFEERYYNSLGQLTQAKHARVSAGTGDANRLVDNYAYDQFGQRIQHWNNQYGSTVIEKTAYDGLGRLTSQTNMEGHVASTAYNWDGTLGNTLGSTVLLGAWRETVSYSDNTMTSTARTDIYDREIDKTDLGGHAFATSYDAAGRMIGRTTGATTQSWQWYNTGLLKQSSGLNGVEDYGYDKVGNRLTEKLVSGGSTIKDATATYDALNRLTSFSQAATSYVNGSTSYTSPDIQTNYAYDAVGNIRQTVSTRDSLDGQGGIASSNLVDTYWYRYDGMNRLVVDKGVLSGTAGAGGTTIVRGSGAGIDIQYDYANERKAVLRTNVRFDEFFIPWLSETRESYEYYGDGTLGGIRVTSVGEVLGSYNASTGQYEPISALPGTTPGAGPLRSYFTYDLMGRQVSQRDSDGGSNIVYSSSTTYNKIGQITYEATSAVKADGKTYGSTSSYSYANGSGQYLLGAVYQVSGSTSVTGSSTKYNTTTNSYAWYDGAVQSQIDFVADTSSPSKIGRSVFTNDVFGQLISVNVDVDASDGDGSSTGLRSGTRDRNVFYKLGGDGQVVRRDEVDGIAANGDPHELWYRFNGRELGYIGNDGTADVSAESAIYGRQQVSQQGAFRNEQTYGSSHSDTSGGSYTALNSYQQGSVAGGYTVQTTGESLRSVALQLWGDASLWYKLAEANGLQAEVMLIEGQRLTIPAGVTKSGYSADTLKPYDANDAIGNVSPTSPKPKKNNKCGVFGQILLAAVAIAVTAVLKVPIATALNGGTAAAAGSSAAVGGAVAAGAAGSAVSQSLGVATGIQQKFSFKAVALAGIGAGVGAGLSIGNVGGSPFLTDVANGALRSAVTQGIGVVTGLQSKFSWVGVAAAGIGAGVGNGLVRELNHQPLAGRDSSQSFANIVGNTFGNTAGAMAVAATRSVLSGGSFGDNLMRSLPDAIGNTVGNLVAGDIAGRGRNGPTGVGNASSAKPRPGEGGGQVGGDDGDIVVTAGRSSTFGYVGYFPQITAVLMSFDRQQGGAEYAVSRQMQRVAATLGQQIVDATAPLSPLGVGAAERKFTYVGGPNNGDTSDGLFTDNPYFYNRETQTIDYYELASGSAQAVLRTDPVRTQMLDDGLSELNWGLGGFLGSSIVGGATGAVGVAFLGEGLLGGGLTAGFSGANASAVMRYSLGSGPIDVRGAI